LLTACCSSFSFLIRASSLSYFDTWDNSSFIRNSNHWHLHRTGRTELLHSDVTFFLLKGNPISENLSPKKKRHMRITKFYIMKNITSSCLPNYSSNNIKWKVSWNFEALVSVAQLSVYLFMTTQSFKAWISEISMHQRQE